MQVKMRWYILVHSAQDKLMILPTVTRWDLLDIVLYLCKLLQLSDKVYFIKKCEILLTYDIINLFIILFYRKLIQNMKKDLGAKR